MGVKAVLSGLMGDPDGRLMFWCPGCDSPHGVPVAETNQGRCWGFNGDYERPTLTPSLLTRYPIKEATVVCHCFVREGRIEFLSDCTHALAGQTVDLPDWDTAHLDP